MFPASDLRPPPAPFQPYIPSCSSLGGRGYDDHDNHDHRVSRGVVIAKPRENKPSHARMTTMTLRVPRFTLPAVRYSPPVSLPAHLHAAGHPASRFQPPTSRTVTRVPPIGDSTPRKYDIDDTHDDAVPRYVTIARPLKNKASCTQMTSMTPRPKLRIIPPLDTRHPPPALCNAIRLALPSFVLRLSSVVRHHSPPTHFPCAAR
jgi:hypothetical protein